MSNTEIPTTLNTEQALIKATAGQVRAMLRVWDDVVNILQAADVAEKALPALKAEGERLRHAHDEEFAQHQAALAKFDLEADRIKSEREATLRTLAQAIQRERETLAAETDKRLDAEQKTAEQLSNLDKARNAVAALA
jgi:hypothetical protein